MSLPFSSHIKEIADDMGVSLFQRLSFNGASLFLSCSETDLQNLIEQKSINCTFVSEGNIQFFGHQLVSYLLNNSTQNTQITSPSTPDRIIRAKEVQEMTGLSRTTIWRYQRENTFPKRIPLGEISVGWKLSEVQEWIQEK